MLMELHTSANLVYRKKSFPSKISDTKDLTGCKFRIQSRYHQLLFK